MSLSTTKYIRRPLFVGAVRITGENFDEVASWCQGEVEQDEMLGKGPGKKYIRVRVHNPKNPRQTKAFVGDWLLYTERGYKVYTNKAFHSSFNKAEGESEEEISGNGNLIVGTEEIIPGITLNEAIAWLRDQSEFSLAQIREWFRKQDSRSPQADQVIEQTAPNGR